MNSKFFASTQFALGIIAVIVIVVSYVKINPMIKAITYDSSANNSEALKEALDASIAASEKWIKISGEKCASESTLQAFAAMRSELPKLNAVISSSTKIISSVEKNLPIKMSSVTENTKTIKLPIPYIEEGAQKIELPSFKIDEKEEKITQIEFTPILDKKYFLTVCKGQNQNKCEGSLIEYVKQIDIKPIPYSWKHPVVMQSVQQISVHIPKISLKEQSFDIQEVKISSQPIMGDVKEQLQLLSQQLTAMSTLPSVADNWIQLLQKELEQCPANDGREIIVALKNNLSDARDKITIGQGTSSEVFKAMAEFVPCLFLILGLLAAAMAASGAAKLFSEGKKDDDKNCSNNNDTTQAPVQQEIPPYEQSASVEQQS